MPLLYGPTNSLGSLTIHFTVLVRTWSVRDNLEKKVNNGSLSRGRANGGEPTWGVRDSLEKEVDDGSLSRGRANGGEPT